MLLFFSLVFGMISFVKVMLSVPKLCLYVVLCLLSINVLIISVIVFLFFYLILTNNEYLIKLVLLK